MLERLFPISENTITGKRTRLDTEKIDKLTFFRKNLYVLKTLFEQNLNEDEQNQEKLENDQSSSKSPVKSIKKKIFFSSAFFF
jgi:hypothetical protein